MISCPCRPMPMSTRKTIQIHQYFEGYIENIDTQFILVKLIRGVKMSIMYVYLYLYNGVRVTPTRDFILNTL